MAPSYTDLIQLIKNNCEVFLGREALINVCTQLDSKGQWHAHVLKTVQGSRSAVFSENGDTPHAALMTLHRSSAQAVDNLLSTNGFDLPPDAHSSERSCFCGRKLKRDDGSKDMLDVESLDGGNNSESSDSESASASASEDEDASDPGSVSDSDSSCASHHHTSKRNGRGKKKGRGADHRSAPTSKVAAIVPERRHVRKNELPSTHKPMRSGVPPGILAHVPVPGPRPLLVSQAPSQTVNRFSHPPPGMYPGMNPHRASQLGNYGPHSNTPPPMSYPGVPIHSTPKEPPMPPMVNNATQLVKRHQSHLHYQLGARQPPQVLPSQVLPSQQIPQYQATTIVPSTQAVGLPPQLPREVQKREIQANSPPSPPMAIPSHVQAQPHTASSVKPPTRTSFMLCIRHGAYGEANILEDCVLSVPALKMRVREVLVLHGLGLFGKGTDDNNATPAAVDWTTANVVVKKLCVGKQVYVLGSGFQGDLSALQGDNTQLLRCEIEVSEG